MFILDLLKGNATLANGEVRLALRPDERGDSGYILSSSGMSFTQWVPAMMIWGLAFAACKMMISKTSQSQMGRWERLAGEVEQRLNDHADQGSYRVDDWPEPTHWGGASKVLGISIQHRNHVFPDLEPSEVLSLLAFVADQIFHNRPYRTDPGFAPESYRTLIVDYLRVSRVWGSPSSAERLGIDRDSQDNLARVLDSYEQLLSFVSSKRSSALGSKASTLGEAPFGVDWYLRLKLRNIDFTLAESLMQAIWNNAVATSESGSWVEMDACGYRWRLLSDWIETGRLGWVDAIQLYDLSEFEEE